MTTISVVRDGHRVQCDHCQTDDTYSDVDDAIDDYLSHDHSDERRSGHPLLENWRLA